MNDEEEIIIAFLFKHSGKKELSFSDLYLTLSMELNWFTPEDAKKFLNQAIKNHLLNKKEEQVTPTYDYDKIDIPVGFQPTQKVFQEKKIEKPKEKKEKVLNQIIKELVQKSKLDEKKIMKKIKEVEKFRNLTVEVAALLVGKEYNIVFDEEILEKVEEEIFQKK
jgi:hypothetical protein